MKKEAKIKLEGVTLTLFSASKSNMIPRKGRRIVGFPAIGFQ